MYNRYQDAMALVHKYGKPDLFITMTCNPSWDEITEELLAGQTHQDRPDLTTRIFRAKLENMRTRNDPNFAKFLKDIGDGVATTYGNDMVRIPDEMVIPWAGDNSIALLFNAIYPNIHENAFDRNYMVERAILAPTNESVDAINNVAITSFPG